MAPRLPRRGLSVARRLAEQARVGREDSGSAAHQDPRVASAGGFAAMVDALRRVVEQVGQVAREARDAAATEAGQAQGTQQAPLPHGSTDHGFVHGISLGGAGGQAVFGYTLRVGPQGVSAEPFGNVSPEDTRHGHGSDVPHAMDRQAGGGGWSHTPQARRPAANAPAPRQPIAEVFEDGDSVVVVAELPGADPDAIVCHVETQNLLIEASGARRYRKEIALPAHVRSEGVSQSFRNGILEVRMRRAAAP